ncbi:TIGR00725 family protein [Mastigocoleus testarum]|uniref:Cytochrome n=1 Tax=Mastigocoleus testarum BC008 TaxID=371196 RepID=A0A0V7ZNZ0_9CYAN|nr:TIGR00725 family protein [Mastigocoleus testarum]KST66142.1 cytochrome [Mastigocoleus testarum BC008]
MKKIIIGVMGPGKTAKEIDLQNAYQLGKLIAKQDWILLTGGRNIGVMDAASCGAKSVRGLTVGILPDRNLQNVSKFVDIPIVTNMGSARNNINVLSSHVVIACGIGPGTVSEIALALKANKKVIFLTDEKENFNFFEKLSPQLVYFATNPEAAMSIIEMILNNDNYTNLK